MLEYVLRVMPLPGWGLAWLVAGATAIGSAFVHIPSPDGDDALGFASLMTVSFTYSSALLCAAAFNGSGPALRSGLTWLLVTGILAIVSGWEETPR